MLVRPAAMFAATTTLQYRKRSYKTRHVPAVSSSQDSKLSLIAICASASSALSSKSVEYGVARMASRRPEKSGWNVKNASMTSSGESATVRCAARASGERCCSQYHSHTPDNSIASSPILFRNPSSRQNLESQEMFLSHLENEARA